MNRISVLPNSMPGYQERMTRFSDPPARLFLRGQHECSQKAVAIIGSRKHSPYALTVLNKIIPPLARLGIRIISGLALGIDALAHKAALDSGGNTTAVLPGGIDRIYPASNRGLAERILQDECSALVSEYPAGTLPMKHYFIARNSIVAGLSDAVVVIEAAAKSGTLITAEFALEMGIPVLAVPGPITSSFSIGTNRLIQHGAAMVLDASDILDEIGVQNEAQIRIISKPLVAHPTDQLIIDALFGQEPLNFSILAYKTGLDPSLLAQRLTHLELQQFVQNPGNNTWLLK